MAPLTIAYYVTGHGLGHATRVSEVVRNLIAAGHVVHINTAAPRWVFDSGIDGLGRERLHLRDVLLDTGAKQADALSVDRAGSLQQYAELVVEPREELLVQEIAWLRGARVDVVVSDIVPIACAAAEAAGVPALCVSNFAWDFVYAEYLTQSRGKDSKDYRALLWQISEDFSKATLLLRLPGHCPMPSFRDVQDVPLVVRRARRTRSEVRAALGLEPSRRVVLYQFGGQDASWKLPEDALPAGWTCLIASKCGDAAALPPNFIRVGAEEYTPDLVNACDCVLGKIGYGTASESLAHGVPLVFIRRTYFNEEPFLRKLLELHSCQVEMSRRDFFEGNWGPYLERALELAPSYSGSLEGGKVVAEAVAAVAEKRYDTRAANTHGRLRDAILFGYHLQRGAPDTSLLVPEWYTRGVNPPALSGEAGEAGKGRGAKRRRVGTGQLPGDLEVVSGDTRGLEDTDAFLEQLGALQEVAQSPQEGGRLPETRAARGLFVPGGDIFVTRAPGRLDVMGGIADYSGSLVLELPTSEACHVALQRQPGTQPAWKHTAARHTKALAAGGGGHVPTIRVVSLKADENNRAPAFDMDLSDLRGPGGEPISYEAAREYFAKDPSRQWAAYVVGTMVVLMREKGARFEDGMSILVDSHVPEGKGVSSSAAVEVAAMAAVAAAHGIELPPRELAVLCQMCENRVVGAPCGVMDQMASACGDAGRLMALLCQPAELQEHVPVPAHIAFWGVDSGIRHSVGGSDYGSVRVGTFMGKSVIAAHAAQERARGGGGGDGESIPTVPSTSSALVTPKSAFYLADIHPSEFARGFAAHIPSSLTGRDFLKEFGGHGDAATSVDPDATYDVRECAAHPVREMHRVQCFQGLLAAPESPFTLEALGELMYQSHESYSAVGIGSDGTDRLVMLVREMKGRGLYGAKITGGGSGGTVCVMGRSGEEAETALREVVDRYEADTGHRPHVFAGSSPGAGSFGHLVVRAGGTGAF